VKELEDIEVFEEEVISIRRVTKVVKGGKNLRFSAAVVVGDKKVRSVWVKVKPGKCPLPLKKLLLRQKRIL